MLFKQHYPSLGFAVYEGRVTNWYAEDLMTEYVSVPLGLRKPKLQIILNSPPPAPVITATRSFPTCLPAPAPFETPLSSATISHIFMTIILIAAICSALSGPGKILHRRSRKAVFECAAPILLLIYQLRFLFDLSILPTFDSGIFFKTVEVVTDSWDYAKPFDIHEIMETRDFGNFFVSAVVHKSAWFLASFVCFINLCNGLHFLFDRIFDLRLALRDLGWGIICAAALDKTLPGVLSMFHGTQHDVAEMVRELTCTLTQLAQQRGLLVKDIPYAAIIIALATTIAYLNLVTAETSRLLTAREISHQRTEVHLQSKLLSCLQKRTRHLETVLKAFEDRHLKLLRRNNVLLLMISHLRLSITDSNASASAHTTSNMGDASELAFEADVSDIDEQGEAAGTGEMPTKKKRNRKRGGAGRPRNEFGLVGVGKRGKRDGGAEGGPSTSSA